MNFDASNPQKFNMEIFRLFKPEWAELSPNKKENKSITCSACAEFEEQIQEKHELVLTLVNKGNDIQKELQNCQEREIELNSELAEMRKTNENFVKILNEYEGQMREALSCRDKVLNENKQTKKHLENLELAFADVHSKYEKSKQVVEANRDNEITLWESIKENERTIMDLQHRYAILKEETTNKLNLANTTLNQINQKHEEELNRYKTKVRTLEVKLDSVENSLKQKTLENGKLSSICEEFITKIDIK